MKLVQKSVLLDTLLGQIHFVFSVSGMGVTESDLSISVRTFTPKIPAGMKVKSCRAILFSLECTNQAARISYSATLDTRIVGGPCTGERLEAIEWDKEGLNVSVGTEDSEALKNRMPYLNIRERAGVATYSEDQITVEIPECLHIRPATFHFVVADTAKASRDDASGWFAVDVLHKRIRQLFE